MNDVNRKALSGFLKLFVVVAVTLFAVSGTVKYWQAWVFLVVFFGSSLWITFYLAKNDPELLERRINAGPRDEMEKSQKIIQLLAAFAFIAVLVVPALDHRFGWSSVLPYVCILGDIMVALGFLAVFFTFRENTFASAIIEVGSEQKIISTGPYALVRHPMYIGALVLLLGIPLALGSWWGLLTIVPMTLVIVWRLLEEEKFLAENLSGYSDYQNKVKYRLLPFAW